MRKIYAAVLAALTLTALMACGNTGAQNKSQKKTATDTKAVMELTSEEFNSRVYDTGSRGTDFLGTRPAIVDFTATWCGPCRNIAPILEEIAKEYKGQIDVYKVDVDKCKDIAQAFGIKSIPAILYIPLDGDPSMTIGARNKARFITEIETILLGN